MYWYVLFVQTGKEKKIEEILKKHLSTKECIPFIPMEELLFKKSGITKKEMRILFPGYVFVESDLQEQQFLRVINFFVNTISELVCVLKYSDKEIAMKESERHTLINLYNNNHCIELSYGVFEGDRVHIFEGPLKGQESIIKKINRHKRQAWIEIEIMGEVRLVNVALEVVNKVEESKEVI